MITLIIPLYEYVMYNKKAKCVVYGRCMFLNVHTGHHTNLRNPNLIMLVSVTSHCCVGSADDIGYSA
jgi:hypothetical protein